MLVLYTLFTCHYDKILYEYCFQDLLGRVHNCIRARVKVLMCGSVVQN